MSDEELNLKSALGQNVPLSDGLGNDLKCEICGKPATIWVQDLMSNHSQAMVSFDKLGDPHYFCTAHKRVSNVVPGLSPYHHAMVKSMPNAKLSCPPGNDD